MPNLKIPQATAKRLPMYYRYLNMLVDGSKTRVSSTELAEAIQVDSATVRRDFSYFGALGKRGYGYDVANLLRFFKKTLNQEHLTNVALIGVGNLGNALLNYNFKKSNNVRISAAFDNNPKITGTIQSGVPIYPMEELQKQLEFQEIHVVILTVPAPVAQAVADKVVQAGVLGIMNFTPMRLNVPAHVRVQSVDLANELQTLIYYLHHYENDED